MRDELRMIPVDKIRVIMEKNKILIIDDDKLITWSLSRDLTSLGYKVETGRDGRSGVKKCTKIAPDLVLIDSKLTDIAGL